MFLLLYQHLKLFVSLFHRVQLHLAHFLSISKLNDLNYFLQVKFCVCLTELSYMNKITSSILSFHRAKHENLEDKPSDTLSTVKTDYFI